MDIIFVGAANPETERMITAVQRAQPDFRVRGFLDNDRKKNGTTFLGYPVFGGLEVLDQVKDDAVRFVNLITGSTKARYETSRYLAEHGCMFANFIHPSIDLTMTELGVGNYLQEAVVVQANARIGNNSSVHMGGLISHEVTIGHSVFIAHAVSISGCVVIGDGTFVGTNATIVPRLKIGRWVTIGAGSVVLKDIPDGATVVGNPGKVIKITEPPYPSGDIFAGLPR